MLLPEISGQALAEKGRYKNSKTKSSVLIKSEKRCWATKKAMDILKPEQAISLVRKAKKKNTHKHVHVSVIISFQRRDNNSSSLQHICSVLITQLANRQRTCILRFIIRL
jgi:hypothetical protein